MQARVKGVFRPFPGLGATLVEIGASEYQYTFIDRNYSLHNHVAPLIAGRIIPANGWAWLSLAPDAIAQVSAYLFGDRFACGIVGELAHHGDTTSVAAHMQVQAHPPLIPVQAQAERALRQFATTWVLNSSTGGDAWVKGQYVFVRATVINDLHELLVREQVAQTPSTPALLLTRLADYGLLMAHKIPDGQPKSIFTMRVTAPTGAVVSERFSALVVPASRVFGIGQAKQFGGDIKILLPDLPPEHVLILATSVPSSNPRQEYPIVSPAPSSAPIVTPAPAAPTAMASPAPNPALVAPAPVVSSAPAPVVSSAPAPVVSSVPSPAPAPAVSSAPPFPLASSAPGVIDDDVMALLQSQLSGGMAQLNATGDYIPSNHVDVPPIVTAFVAWAKQGLDGGQITMNAKGALVHGLPDLPRCVGLVSPVSFLQFITATGYVWGEREHIDSGNMDHLGLRATLEQLQQKFRACKWAPQSGADPGKNVFHYQIGENGPTLTLVALSEEGTRALLSAKEWAPNSVLIRRRTHDNSSKAQKPKTKRPLPQQPKGKGGASLIEAKSGSPADRFKG